MLSELCLWLLQLNASTPIIEFLQYHISIQIITFQTQPESFDLILFKLSQDSSIGDFVTPKVYFK